MTFRGRLFLIRLRATRPARWLSPSGWWTEDRAPPLSPMPEGERIQLLVAAGLHREVEVSIAHVSNEGRRLTRWDPSERNLSCLARCCCHPSPTALTSSTGRRKFVRPSPSVPALAGSRFSTVSYPGM